MNWVVALVPISAQGMGWLAESLAGKSDADTDATPGQSKPRMARTSHATRVRAMAPATPAQQRAAAD